MNVCQGDSREESLELRREMWVASSPGWDPNEREKVSTGFYLSLLPDCRRNETSRLLLWQPGYIMPLPAL